jgi:hypothetical protein
MTTGAEVTKTAGVTSASSETIDESDPLLEHHLTVTQDDPELFAIALAGSRSQVQSTTNTSKLVKRAVRSMSAWVASGLRCVSTEERKRRLLICSTCPNLRSSEMRGLHRLVSSQDREAICGLCGCVLRHKASLATEVCPDRTHGNRGRW